MKPKSSVRPLFDPIWKEAIPPHDDYTNKKPDVVVAIGLVNYGYQVDYYVGGKFMGSSCRDFGGSYPIKKLQERFVTVIEEAINQERAKL